MTTTVFPSVGDLVRSGRAFVKGRMWFVLGLVLVAGVLDSILAFSLYQTGLFPEKSLQEFVLMIGQALFRAFLSLGLAKVLLDIVDEKQYRFADLFSASRKMYLSYLGASVLFFLLATIGFIFLIIPGIYVVVRYGMYCYVAVERPGLSPVEILRETGRLTKGHFWRIFLFSISIVLLNVLGALVFLVGLLYTIPVTTMAGVALYRTLTRMRDAEVNQTVVPNGNISAEQESPKLEEGVAPMSEPETSVSESKKENP